MSAEVGEESKGRGPGARGLQVTGLGLLPTGNTEQLCKSCSPPDGDKVGGRFKGSG